MANVKPIPPGYHTLVPHLVIKGASQAIDFYKKAFGAEEVMRIPTPDGKLLHSELKIGDSRLFMADEMPMDGCTKSPQTLGGSPVVLHLWSENADATFNTAVKAGAKVIMPMWDAFWGDRYGQVLDPFGHVWSIATHMKDLTADQIRKAGEEAMAQFVAKK